MNWIHTMTTFRFKLDGREAKPVVTARDGSGRLRIRAQVAEVITHAGDDDAATVFIEGKTILANGLPGRWRQTGWSVGGRWDDSTDAPEWVLDLARRASSDCRSADEQQETGQ